MQEHRRSDFFILSDARDRLSLPRDRVLVLFRQVGEGASRYYDIPDARDHPCLPRDPAFVFDKSPKGVAGDCGQSTWLVSGWRLICSGIDVCARTYGLVRLVSSHITE